MTPDRQTAYAQYLVDNKDKTNTPEYRTVLQAYIASRAQPQPQAPEPAPQRPSLTEWGSEAADLGERAAKSVISAVRGPQGLPEGGQFPVNEKAIFGMMLTPDPEKQANIVRKNMPNVQTLPIEADGKKYVFAADDKGNSGYINPPGLDRRDVLPGAVQTAAFMPAAKWASGGKNLVTRAIKGFGGGAATDAALQKGAQKFGSGEGIDWPQTAVVGGISAALEPLAPMVKAGWRRVFSNKENFNPRTGSLTENGRRLAIKAGLNPDEMNESVAREFGRLTREGDVPPDVLRRATLSTEFNIPATRGQLTQDYNQLNLEDRMRRSLEGDEPKRVISDFDKSQTEAISGAQRYVQTQVSGKKEAATRPAESAEAIKEGLDSRRASMGRQVDEAYDTARAMDDTPGIGPFYFGQQARQEIPNVFRNALSESVVDEVLTPASFRAVNDIEALLAKPQNLNLGTVETARRRLNKYIGTATNREDQRNLIAMKNGLDGWIEDTINKGLFSGDEAILRQLQQARALRAETGRLFESKDAGGKIVSAILEKAQTPEEVVNYLFGASKLGAKQQTASGVRKLAEIVGKESDEWGSIKEIAWMKLSRDRQGNPLSPAAFDKAWKEALNENKTLINELFSVNEQGLIRRYNEALQATKRESTNPSQSAFALESALRYTLRRFGQRESFTKGNVGGGTVLNFLARAPINPLGASSIARERQAVRAISPFDVPPRTAPIVPAAGASGARQREERQ